MDVIQALKQKQGLTDTEAAIADCILLHLDDVTQMTIGELSGHAHCSGSAIVRLCHKVGVSGYRDLRIELARSLERTRTGMLDVNPDRPFIEGNGTADIRSSIAALTKQAVDATYASVSNTQVRQAARLVLGARRIVYYAVGDSLVSTEAFATLLLKIGITCTSGLLKGDLGVIAQMMDARDLVVIVSHSGALLNTYRRTFEMLRSRGCKMLLLTADTSIRQRMLGIECLVELPQGETRSDRLATFYSQACIRYALNCIYAEAFAANYRENVDNWSVLARLEDEGRSS